MGDDNQQSVPRPGLTITDDLQSPPAAEPLKDARVQRQTGYAQEPSNMNTQKDECACSPVRPSSSA
ncbi:hypothetical protein BIW11_03622 [Tropilaelaps mercedesae]|uniref:Uncharacterized protein n=1 Tax=Tropilaelaps mercedesae TaxID=418985 RepID=A0A1V9XIR1_9ACAR|nr:hypothetical protein BIW11_03622 [Tropilaelaps mercedesae]